MVDCSARCKQLIDHLVAIYLLQENDKRKAKYEAAAAAAAAAGQAPQKVQIAQQCAIVVC